MRVPQDREAKKLPWWVHFIGPGIGIATLQLLQHFVAPLSAEMRQLLVEVGAIVIAAGLSYAIYRFVRT